MSGIGPIGGGGARPQGLAEIMQLRQQILERSDGLQQFRSNDAAKVGGAATAAPEPEPAAPASNNGASSFADTLSNAIDNVNAVQKRSGDMQAAYERGEVTDIAQVMMARQESGVAFEATMQVRNKLLSAYQEIMRMGG